MRTIKKIIVHCSNSNRPEDDSIGAIRCLHICKPTMKVPFGGELVTGFGWFDIGYHAIITSDGRYFQGRPDKIIGAHCKGDNADSLGVCVTGKNKEDFTEVQFKTLAVYLRQMVDKYMLTRKDIVPHSKYNLQKTCPVFDLDNFKKLYL